MTGADPHMAWRDRPVLVTGAAGLLGSWLTRTLADLGARVVALVRDGDPDAMAAREGTLERVAVVRGELEDLALLVRVVNEFEIDAAFHLGAQTIVPTANRHPLSTFESNVRGTWNVCEAVRQVGRGTRLVVASSDKAYGASEHLPYTEDTPLQPAHPYDVSKACADMIARSYAATWDLPIAVVRACNIYGGGDLNFNRLVPGTIRSALRGQRPVIRSDGRFSRDYLYIEDAVDGYLTLAGSLGREDVRGRAFNLGTGVPVLALDLARRVLERCGRGDLELDVRGSDAGEIRHQSVDATRARAVLGWRPRHDLSAGLDRTIAWYRRHLDEEGAHP